ncbi:MAG: ParB N-terminal domain-containing protein [Bacteroidales bacterium]|jgi:hypothetical protein
MKVDINLLKEHPLNKEIYGMDNEEQVIELVEKIRNSGWIKPIIITKDFTIVSGHLRTRAAKQLGYTEIDCEFIDGDPDKQLELLLNENAYRTKTTLQKTKEGEYYRQIESKKAYERQIAGVNLGVSETQGRTNEIVAGKIGLSESSYKKSQKVLHEMEKIVDPSLQWLIGETLNTDITAADKLVEKPIEFMQAVSERIDGDVKNVGKMIRQLEREELCKTIPLPPGKYQVIYIEYGTNPIDQHYQLPLADVGEDNSVLFFWTTPPTLEQSLKMINGWGFRYKTAFLWNKDVLSEISDLAEILLFAVKGNPPMIKQTTEHGVVEKPPMVRQMIEQVYKGSKILLTLGEGWRDW